MTSKLKCPFCGSELRIDNIGFYVCPTVHCALWECEGVPQKVIKSLISGKKAQEALKVAIDALSNIDTFNCHGKGAMEVISGMASIANRALYEITSITKGKDNDLGTVD